MNINKIAVLRNSRGGTKPNLVQTAKDCEKFGAEGITIHPRPDERHITTNDVYELAKIVTTEFNIEGYPSKRYLELIKKTKPTQATLVPDPPNAITSTAGWDIYKNYDFLSEKISLLKEMGTRVSVFIFPNLKDVQGAKDIGADRIEFYTGPYAKQFHINKEEAILPYVEAASLASKLGLGVNAGHDLDLYNLNFMCKNLPKLDEVSIGHALICDSLYLGLENTIQLYKRKTNYS